MKVKSAAWTAVVVVSCSLWAGAGPSWAMGPGGACPTTGGGAKPMQTLMSLDKALDLKPEQRQAWDEFVATVNARRGEMMGTMMAQRASSSDGPAPEHLRNNASMFEKRARMMREMADALDKLYAELAAEQQAIVDQTIAGHDEHGG